MKTKHLFWGFLFITIGILILLNNITNFTLYWFDIWKYWPFLLILIGISLLIKSTFIRGTIASIAAIIIGISLFAMLKSGWGFFQNDVFSGMHHGITIKGWDDNDYKEKNFVEDFNNKIKTASLNLKAGEGSFRISDTTASLFAAVAKEYGDNFSLSSEIDSENAKLTFGNDKKLFIFGRSKNKVDISLNKKPVWNLNFDIGAASSEFDLRSFKIKDVDINTGAASLKIYLGDLEDTTNVEIDAGASSIEISVPENSGCELKADVTLSSKRFDRFNKIGDALYRTENFDNASKKIFLKIDSGVSSVRIKRYSPRDWL
jgi:LiaI-LiaF-like transmembrane region